MRKRGRTDANQPATVAALRKIGATVAITSSLGGGFPDLVVGYHRLTVMVELKDGDRPPSARRLTVDERDFHHGWTGGPLIVAESPEDAVLKVISAAEGVTR